VLGVVLALNIQTIVENVNMSKWSNAEKISEGKFERKGNEAAFTGSQHDEGSLEYFVEYTNKFYDFAKLQPEYKERSIWAEDNPTITYINSKNIIYNITVGGEWYSGKLPSDVKIEVDTWSIKQVCQIDVFWDIINDGGIVEINWSAGENLDFYKKKVSKSECVNFLSKNN
jgi:hypothetical protein